MPRLGVEKELCEFLVDAKKSTYAAWESAKKIKEKDKSTTLIYEKDDFKYHDNYFWGEPFWWREVVFHKEEPIYIMTYYGSVIESILDFSKIYKFLQKALSLIPEDKPFRGPEIFSEDWYTYLNKISWEINNFSVVETIIDKNKNEIYKAFYSWWYIDQRK